MTTANPSLPHSDEVLDPAGDVASVTVLPGRIDVEGETVRIRDLLVEDRTLADLLATAPPSGRGALAARALEIGARSLVSGGIGIDVSAVDARVQGTVATVIEEAERRVESLMAAGTAAFAESFDPERRSSLVGRSLVEFQAWRDSVLGDLDPARADSHTAAFLGHLTDLLGPEGALESRLAEALDPEADGSALARLDHSIDQRFAELRDLIVRETGRSEGEAAEAARGTAQGIGFEDQVEGWLRAEAAGVGGCIVERVSTAAGDLGPKSRVGDFVFTAPEGRIAIEAKLQGRLGLTQVLEELDRACENRTADFGVCISGKDAFPAEVGRFGVYGSRVLVVDDGDGTMARLAMRWARAALDANRIAAGDDIDTAALGDAVDEIKRRAQTLSTSQGQLKDAATIIDKVRGGLSELRRDLLDRADDALREIRQAGEC
ncbi:hypothetical protein HQ535_09045 [bacterium]|nr:hypothetical protein [bacterium]